MSVLWLKRSFSIYRCVECVCCVQSVCQSLCASVCLSVCVSVCLSVSVCVYMQPVVSKFKQLTLDRATHAHRQRSTR